MSGILKKDKLKIGNQTYSLIEEPGLIKHPYGEGEAYGVTDFEAREITIAVLEDPALIDETLIHEILEVVKNTISECEFPEMQMDVIARTLIQVLHQFKFSFCKKERKG